MALAIHVPTYRPLRACGFDELAAHQAISQPSGGILFARKKERGEKDEARRYIVDLLGDTELFPQLSVLTMPGVDWKFENKLLGRREGDWAGKKIHNGPDRTLIHSIENDRAIYHAGITRMPPMRSDWGNTRSRRSNPVVHVHPHTSFAERVIGNAWVDRYFFGNVDDLMREPPQVYDAAWLDYTGPLSVERIRRIRSFLLSSVRQVLIVTALRARWNRATSDAIEAAGGHSAWVRGELPGEMLHEINYQDGPSPMAQIALRVVKEES